MTLRFSKHLATGEEIHSSLVLIGIPDLRSLHRAEQKLIQNSIDYYKFWEPLDNMGYTAIATFPLKGEKRRALINYRLWKEKI
jgi:hypothetical protein